MSLRIITEKHRKCPCCLTNLPFQLSCRIGLVIFRNFAQSTMKRIVTIPLTSPCNKNFWKSYFNLVSLQPWKNIKGHTAGRKISFTLFIDISLSNNTNNEKRDIILLEIMVSYCRSSVRLPSRNRLESKAFSWSKLQPGQKRVFLSRNQIARRAMEGYEFSTVHRFLLTACIAYFVDVLIDTVFFAKGNVGG